MSNRLFNAGERWTQEEDEGLVHEFNSGASLADMAQTHGRTGTAICARLEHHNLIRKHPIKPIYIRNDGGRPFATATGVQHVNRLMDGRIERAEPEPEPETKTFTIKESTMSLIDHNVPVTIVSITANGETSTTNYIYGKPSDRVTDDEIFTYIADLESKIESLKSIQNKPEKLYRKIKALEDQISDLARIVDSRP